MSDPDREKTGRVMQALMQMTKIDISKLEDAFQGK
jgi:predicted 3-demethylubiquinone-9 3-methyltransferase (glyoxalase superfamily)